MDKIRWLNTELIVHNRGTHMTYLMKIHVVPNQSDLESKGGSPTKKCCNPICNPRIIPV